MSGKHQIFSSNKKTKQKAKRKWRRQHKERLGDAPIKIKQKKLNPKTNNTPKVERATFSLKPLLDEALKKLKRQTIVY